MSDGEENIVKSIKLRESFVQWHSAARGHEWLSLLQAPFFPSFLPSLPTPVGMRKKVCFTPQNTPSHSPLSFPHSFPHSFCCFCSSTLLIPSLIPPHSTYEASFDVGPVVALSLQQPQSCPVTRRRAKNPRLAHPSRVSPLADVLASLPRQQGDVSLFSTVHFRLVDCRVKQF